MKSKLLISTLLALVMLVTLAAPAFARPVGDNLVPTANAGGPELGNYQCSAKISVTRTNDIKVTVVLKGVYSNALYKVAVYDGTLFKFYSPDQWDLDTDRNGNARGSMIMSISPTHGDGVTVNLQVLVLRASQAVLQFETPLPVDF